MIRQLNMRKTLFCIFALCAFSIGLLFYAVYQKSSINPQQLFKQGIFILDTPRQLSPFNLKDQLDQPYTPASLTGQWSLVFFGFTHCPDICPTTLAMLKQAVSKLDASLQTSTNIILITVDPARDTVPQMKRYVNFFGSGITGVTGEFIELHTLANSLGVPFHKVMLDDGNYTMDHSAYIYLVNPDGHYQAFFKPPFDSTSFAQKYATVRAYLTPSSLAPDKG